MQISQWDYIKPAVLTGDLKADTTRFLEQNGREETAAHCLDVAEQCKGMARRFVLDQAAAATSALLHDISNVIEPADMLSYAVEHDWEIDEAERRYPFLLHQRLSAVMAREVFKIEDERVLSSIACHTTLKPEASEYDIALFLADKLSWDQEGKPPFTGVVLTALDHSLQAAALAYLTFVIDNRMIFWSHRQMLAAKQWLEQY